MEYKAYIPAPDSGRIHNTPDQGADRSLVRSVHILLQVEAVREAAMRANTRVTDAQLMFAAGDLRITQIEEYAFKLAAAFETLKALATTNSDRSADRKPREVRGDLIEPLEQPKTRSRMPGCPCP